MASIQLFGAHSNRVGTKLSDIILRQTMIPRNPTSAVWLIANTLKINQNSRNPPSALSRWCSNVFSNNDGL
jgi:hypothetical protein